MLSRAIESLLAQDCADLELVVSDNGSTDGTRETCLGYAARDRRVRYLREEVNRGPTWNFGRVLEFAERAPYFMWAAHDDRWAPEYASSCIRFLESHPDVVLCATAAAFTYADGRPSGWVDRGFSTMGMSAVDRAVRFARLVEHNSMFYGVYRSAALRGRSLVNQIGGDHILLLELSLAGAFHTLPQVLMWRSIGGASQNIASITRTLGIRLRWPAMLYKVYTYRGFLEKVAQAPELTPRERRELALRLVYVGWSRHFFGRVFSLRNILKRLGWVPPPSSRGEPGW